MSSPRPAETASLKAQVLAARAALSAMKPGLRGMTQRSNAYADALDAMLHAHLPMNALCSWIAVGSYGRKTAGPGSDVDLRWLLAAHDEALSERAAAALRGVLDQDLVGGCQVLTPPEWLTAAQNDLTAATALLDARVIGADGGGLGVLLREARVTLFSPSELGEFGARLGEECAQRAARYGATVYLLEPDLRASPGGLRDMDVIGWSASARFGCAPTEAFSALLDARVISRSVHSDLMHATRFLRSLRCALHARAARRSDRLSFDAQEDVAAQIYPGGSSAVEQLMQRYYVHARAVSRVRERALDACASGGQTAALRVPARDTRFVLEGGKLALAQRTALHADPSLALSAFEHAGVQQLLLHAELRDALTTCASDPTWAIALQNAPEAGERWLGLLANGALMSELDETGMLFAMVPEFEPVRGRAHHDTYHVYTVDVHSVAAVRMLASLARGEATAGFSLASRLAAKGYDKRVLPLAVLLHDLGKGYPDEDGSRRNHAAVGARMVPAIAARLGLTASETARTVLLVEQHLAFYKLATRADLDAPETMAELFAAVPNREALVQLYLLTVVDLETTSPGALNGWKLHVLDALFLRAEEHLRGCVSIPVEALSDAQTELLEATPDGAVGFRATHQGDDMDYIEVAIVLPDGPGALARVASAFATAEMDILGARLDVAPREGRDRPRALDVFWCKRRGQKKLNTAQLRKLEKAVLSCMNGAAMPPAPPPPSWQRRGPSVKTDVRVARSSGGRCSVEVVAEDTPGLLHRLALAFYYLGLDIQLAKINTEGAKAIDVFYVTGASGAPVADADLGRIRTHLLEALGHSELP